MTTLEIVNSTKLLVHLEGTFSWSPKPSCISTFYKVAHQSSLTPTPYSNLSAAALLSSMETARKILQQIVRTIEVFFPSQMFSHKPAKVTESIRPSLPDCAKASPSKPSDISMLTVYRFIYCFPFYHCLH